MLNEGINFSDPDLIEGFLAVIETGNTSAATQAMSDAIEGCSGLQLAFIDGVGNFNQSTCLGVDPRTYERLAIEFNTPEKNPVIASMAKLPFGRFTDVRDFVDMGVYLESEFYNELLAPREPARVAMMAIPGQAGMLSLGLEQDATASLEQAQVATWFGRQIHRALGLWFASAAPGHSAFLVDAGGSALGISARKVGTASLGTLTASGPGRQVRTSHTRLQSEFDAKFKAALTGVPSAMIASGDKSACQIRFLPASGLAEASLVWIEATELRPNPWTAASLSAVHGLTPREASVVLELIAGNDTRTTAETLGITPRSVRTYLSSVFAKTGTESQVQLLSLLLGQGG